MKVENTYVKNRNLYFEQLKQAQKIKELHDLAIAKENDCYKAISHSKSLSEIESFEKILDEGQELSESLILIQGAILANMLVATNSHSLQDMQEILKAPNLVYSFAKRMLDNSKMTDENGDLDISKLVV